MEDLTKQPPVSVEDIGLGMPNLCAGCGTAQDTRQYWFKTYAWTTQRQIIPYCPSCVRRVIEILEASTK